jgi:hypothetical protein
LIKKMMLAETKAWEEYKNSASKANFEKSKP